MIKILNIQTQSTDLGISQSRFADIIISDGVKHYRLGVGGLPLAGDLQTILDTREAELWEAAEAENNLLTTRQVRRKIYNSTGAGGWDRDDYQEAVFEKSDGDETKWDILKARRAMIRAEWPL